MRTPCNKAFWLELARRERELAIEQEFESQIETSENPLELLFENIQKEKQIMDIKNANKPK